MSIRTRGSDASRVMPARLHCHLLCPWGRSGRGGQPALAKAALCKKTTGFSQISGWRQPKADN